MVALSLSEPDTIIPPPDKLERAVRRERSLSRERARQDGRVARQLTRDARETLFPDDRSWLDSREPMDDLYASLAQIGADLVRDPPVTTPESLFQAYYGGTTGRAREAARRFLRKRFRTGVVVGSIVSFDGRAWLVLEGKPSADGVETWTLVRLNTFFAHAPSDDPRAAEIPLVGMDACPHAIACLDLTNVARKDFVDGCRAFARIGRVPRRIAETVAAAVAECADGRTYTESRARRDDDLTTGSVFFHAQEAWLAQRTQVVQPRTETAGE